MTDFEYSVYQALLLIPKGRVVTYALVASMIGREGSQRAVGNALHKNPDPDRYPCYKVVSGEGKLAEHFALGIEEQRRRLEDDGIRVVDYRVDLGQYLWHGEGNGTDN